MQYLVILESDVENGAYSAYCPDVPGCIAAADTPEETLRLMQEALTAHIQWMKDDGDPIPLPVTKDANALDANEHSALVNIQVA